jgi:vacuolar-type H+-ATPase subunit I/STV1
MAEAVVRAQMTMDAGQFTDAVKKSTHEMKKVKAESADLQRSIGGMNQVAQGFGAVLSGNVSQGLAAVGGGLNALAPKIMAVLGPIGMVAAAFTAAYAAGKKLFDIGVTDFSDRLVSAFGTTTDETDETARQTAILRARREGRQEAAKIEDENARLAEQRLEGVAALDAKFARQEAEIRKQMEKAKTDDVRAALQSRLEMLSGFHAEDVAAVKKAEQDKAEAVKRAEEMKAEIVRTQTKNRTEQIADENERMRIAAMDEGPDKIAAEYEVKIRKVQEEIDKPETTAEQRTMLEDRASMLSDERQRAIEEAQTEPAKEVPRLPIRMDSLAAVGGFMGGERVNLPVVSKQEQAQIDNSTALKQNGEAIRQLTDQVATLASAMTGGVQ